MNWEQLKKRIYFRDGSLRDIYILDFSMREWEQWIAYADDKYKIEWLNNRDERFDNKTEHDIALEILHEGGGGGLTAKIMIEDIQINAHLFSDTEFESDIEPNQFNSIEDHESLLEYLRNLSALFDKEVILTEEMHPEIILMKVYKDIVSYY